MKKYLSLLLVFSFLLVAPTYAEDLSFITDLFKAAANIQTTFDVKGTLDKMDVDVALSTAFGERIRTKDSINMDEVNAAASLGVFKLIQDPFNPDVAETLIPIIRSLAAVYPVNFPADLEDRLTEYENYFNSYHISGNKGGGLPKDKNGNDVLWGVLYDADVTYSCALECLNPKSKEPQQVYEHTHRTAILWIIPLPDSDDPYKIKGEAVCCTE